MLFIFMHQGGECSVCSSRKGRNIQKVETFFDKELFYFRYLWVVGRAAEL
ncbi:hypothetical protein BDE36_1445 [Arcticibacter tournemirensis]|nr:hypothetical protein BDE36_1445 [Arcticibacter tournemirensis]